LTFNNMRQVQFSMLNDNVRIYIGINRSEVKELVATDTKNGIISCSFNYYDNNFQLVKKVADGFPLGEHSSEVYPPGTNVVYSPLEGLCLTVPPNPPSLIIKSVWVVPQYLYNRAYNDYEGARETIQIPLNTENNSLVESKKTLQQILGDIEKRLSSNRPLIESSEGYLSGLMGVYNHTLERVAQEKKAATQLLEKEWFGFRRKLKEHSIETYE